MCRRQRKLLTYMRTGAGCRAWGVVREGETWLICYLQKHNGNEDDIFIFLKMIAPHVRWIQGLEIARRRVASQVR